MPSATAVHAAYDAQEREAQRRAHQCRKRARPDFDHVAVASRARRLMQLLEPLVLEDTELRAARLLELAA